MAKITLATKNFTKHVRTELLNYNVTSYSTALYSFCVRSVVTLIFLTLTFFNFDLYMTFPIMSTKKLLTKSTSYYTMS